MERKSPPLDPLPFKLDKPTKSYLQSFTETFPSFQLFTAFSRAGPQKIYVQHRLQEQAALVNQLLEQKANFYVCGDASNMAREVSVVLGKIIAEQRGLSAEKGEEVVKAMRSSGQYQEDVWS